MHVIQHTETINYRTDSDGAAMLVDVTIPAAAVGVIDLTVQVRTDSTDPSWEPDGQGRISRDLWWETDPEAYSAAAVAVKATAKARRIPRARLGVDAHRLVTLTFEQYRVVREAEIADVLAWHAQQ